MTKRFFYLSFRIFHAAKRWVRRRFTKAGLLVLVGLIASAVVGLDTHQTLAYQAFTFLFALILASIACSVFFRARLTAHRKLPKFGTVEEPLRYRVVIENSMQASQPSTQLQKIHS